MAMEESQWVLKPKLCGATVCKCNRQFYNHIAIGRRSMAHVLSCSELRAPISCVRQTVFTDVGAQACNGRFAGVACSAQRQQDLSFVEVQLLFLHHGEGQGPMYLEPQLQTLPTLER